MNFSDQPLEENVPNQSVNFDQQDFTIQYNFLDYNNSKVLTNIDNYMVVKFGAVIKVDSKTKVASSFVDKVKVGNSLEDISYFGDN